jgi:gamma-tubulin complex component 2
LISQPTTQDNAKFKAVLKGVSISSAPECLYLKKISLTNVVVQDSTIDQHVKFGDVVTIHSEYALHKALGVRSSQASSSLVADVGLSHEVGFYRSILGEAEQWMILPSSSNRVGLVQSSMDICLRNGLTGGLLSLYECGELSIRTPEQDDWKTIVEGHVMRPTTSEIFRFVLANVPPCPIWSSVEEAPRIYLNGTYLSHDGRNDGMLENSPFYARKSRKPHLNSQKTGGLPLSHQDTFVQDQVLVEEVLGCLIGLEGKMIKAKPIESSQPDQNCFVKFSLVSRSILGGPLDENLTQLLHLILPTCEAFVEANAFVTQRLSSYEHGRVAHALCGAMEILLQEYMEFIIGQQDRFRRTRNDKVASLTLSGLCGEIQPSVRTLSILRHITEVARPLKGGSLLNKLDDLMKLEYLGDDRAKFLFRFLLDRASIPYMAMLRGWLEGGTLKDPYDEFMIEPFSERGNSITNRDDEWNKWFTIREEHVLNVMIPSSTSDISPRDKKIKSMQNKILIAGKYWNAILHCNNRDERAVQLPQSTENEMTKALSHDMTVIDLSRVINEEYTMSSRAFYNILMRDYQVLDILAFMKRYFLLDQGDFFVHFLDMAEDELLQEMSAVSRGRVQNWMALSIQMSGGSVSDWDGDSSAASNKSAWVEVVKSLKCEFATRSLVEHLDALHSRSGGIASSDPKTPSRHIYGGADKGLTGVEAFMLDFHNMPFPLSLILSRHTITNYQLLFRHLFFAKHVERRLVGTWLDHQLIKEYDTLRKDLGQTYCLRQRMLHFMQNFVYYMMFEVIEPNWLDMESKILERKVDKSDWLNGKHSTKGEQITVDDLLGIHNDFVLQTLKECLLTNRELIRTLTKLMTTCLLFSDQMKLFMESTQIVSTRGHNSYWYHPILSSHIEAINKIMLLHLG